VRSIERERGYATTEHAPLLDRDEC